MTSSFDHLATVSASTKRNPAVAGGKVGEPVVYLTDLNILPLMPVSKEIQERYQIKSPRLSYTTYISGNPDIAHGDVLTVDTVDYNVIAASPWNGKWDFIELVVEKVVGA